MGLTAPHDEFAPPAAAPSARDSAPIWRVRRTAATVLACGGVPLAAVGLVLAATGTPIRWEALGISAQNGMRVASEGLFALLAAAALRWDRCDRRTAVAIALLLAAFHASLAGASRTRRVGDGHEYIAMARQLSRASLPGIPVDELETRRAEMAAQPGYDDVDLRAPALVGPDGRQDFVHFWLYPLAAAPLLSLAPLLQLHWNVAFEVLNVALLAMLAYAALLELPVAIVLVLLAGPVIWWVDKAQIEVFNVSLCGLAFLLVDRRPGPALLLLGVLSAQNPAYVAVLAPAAIWGVVAAGGRDRRGMIAWSAAAALVAAVNPAYYGWHLGQLSPLANAASFSWPTITALLTPLVDPMCGFAWYVPGLLVLLALAAPAVAGGWRERDLALGAWGTASFVAVFALASNVNHGGTPGPSRYGVWLIPFTIPLLRRLGAATGWRQAALPAIAIASMGHSMWAFHPRLGERSAEPPAAAAWLIEWWPSLYDPLPEVFAERYGATDGTSPLPVASTRCGKVLLVGEGRDSLSWPIPCLPAPAPPECAVSDALCYASRRADGGYAFTVPPRQASFGYRLSRDLTWRHAHELAWMPAQPRWDRLERVTPFGRGSLVRGGRDLTRIRAFQFGRELLAFVDVRQEGRPVLEIANDAGSDVWVMTRASRRVQRERDVPRDAPLELPTRSREAVVLVKPRS